MYQAQTLRKDPQYDLLFNNLSWVSKDLNFVYIANPKVACTKIKRDLQAICGLDPSADGIHNRSVTSIDYVKSFDHYSDEDVDYLLNSDKVYRFTVVRNPYTRIISAYDTKIRDEGDPQYEGVRNLIKQELGLESEISFSQFIQCLSISKNVKVTADRHWRLQTDGLFLNVIDYSFLGRLENFDQDYAKILKGVGASQALIDQAGKKTNARIKKGWLKNKQPVVYTQETADAVYKLLQPDFETFHYEPDSWQSIAPK